MRRKRGCVPEAETAERLEHTSVADTTELPEFVSKGFPQPKTPLTDAAQSG